MAIRLAFLVAFTASFAAVWSSDQERASGTGRPAAVASRSNHPQRRPSTRPSVLAKTGDAAPQCTAEVVLQDDVPAGDDAMLQNAPATPRRAGPSAATTPEVLLCELPLPADMAPGKYRVITGRDDSLLLSLSAEDLLYCGLSGSPVVRDVYTVREQGERWYFIRLDLPEDQGGEGATGWLAPRRMSGSLPGLAAPVSRLLSELDYQQRRAAARLRDAAAAMFRRSLHYVRSGVESLATKIDTAAGRR